jgi:hypothetical protein
MTKLTDLLGGLTDFEAGRYQNRSRKNSRIPAALEDVVVFLRRQSWVTTMANMLIAWRPKMGKGVALRRR